MRYETWEEKRLAELDPDDPMPLPKRRGTVVLTAEEHTALLHWQQRPVIVQEGEEAPDFRAVYDQEEDEPNDLRHDEERENGGAEDDWLRRRGYVGEDGI